MEKVKAQFLLVSLASRKLLSDTSHMHTPHHTASMSDDKVSNECQSNTASATIVSTMCIKVMLLVYEQ